MKQFFESKKAYLEYRACEIVASIKEAFWSSKEGYREAIRKLNIELKKIEKKLNDLEK